MTDFHNCELDQVFAADGTPVTAANLPRQRPKRWTPRRKAMVVAAVQAGILDMDTACETYEMSGEELLSWLSALRDSGIPGLRVKHRQIHRSY